MDENENKIRDRITILEVKLAALETQVMALGDNNKWLVRLVITGLISGLIAYFWRGNGLA